MICNTDGASISARPISRAIRVDIRTQTRIKQFESPEQSEPTAFPALNQKRYFIHKELIYGTSTTDKRTQESKLDAEKMNNRLNHKGSARDSASSLTRALRQNGTSSSTKTREEHESIIKKIAIFKGHQERGQHDHREEKIVFNSNINMSLSRACV